MMSFSQEGGGNKRESGTDLTGRFPSLYFSYEIQKESEGRSWQVQVHLLPGGTDLYAKRYLFWPGMEVLREGRPRS